MDSRLGSYVDFFLGDIIFSTLCLYQVACISLQTNKRNIKIINRKKIFVFVVPVEQQVVLFKARSATLNSEDNLIRAPYRCWIKLINVNVLYSRPLNLSYKLQEAVRHFM